MRGSVESPWCQTVNAGHGISVVLPLILKLLFLCADPQIFTLMYVDAMCLQSLENKHEQLASWFFILLTHAYTATLPTPLL